MAKLGNVERIEREIFRSGKFFTVKHVVVTGSKAGDGRKLNPVYDRNYKSGKYTDHTELRALNIRTSDFLVFAYNDFQNKDNEEIFISYPHITGFMQVMEQVYNMVNTDAVYTTNGVSGEYANTVLKTPSLGSQKTVAAIPAVVQMDNYTAPGAMFFLNDEDHVVQLDRNAINTLWYILRSFNLYSESSNLLVTGLVWDGGAAGGAADFSTPSGGGNANKGGFQNRNLPKRNIFGNKGAGGNGGAAAGPGTGAAAGAGSFNPPSTNVSMDDIDSKINGNAGGTGPAADVDIPSDDEVPFTGGESGGGQGPLSLGNIMNKAEEIEVPEFDDKDGKVDF
jgi:hypothetical protein